MGFPSSALKLLTDYVRQNEQIRTLTKELDHMSVKVNNIDGRLIRLETVIEIAQNQRLLRHEEVL